MPNHFPPSRRTRSDSGAAHNEGTEYLALGDASMILAVTLLVLASFGAERPAAPAAPATLALQAPPATSPSGSDSGTADANQSAAVSHKLIGRLETLRSPENGEVVVSVPPELFTLLQSAHATKLVTEEQRP